MQQFATTHPDVLVDGQRVEADEHLVPGPLGDGVLLSPARRLRAVDDFVTAAQAAADITAECGNYEMWQLGGADAAGHG